MSHTYIMDDKTYDVAKLDEEGQGLFSLLQVAVANIADCKNQIQLLQAGATHIKDLFEDKLDDSAIADEDKTLN